MNKIIYIDDEINSLKMESKIEIFKDYGIEIIKVAELKYAMSTIEENINSAKLIILDIIIPNNGYYPIELTTGGTTAGIQLLKEIRQIYKDIKIIIVSIIQKDSIENLNEVMNEYNVLDYFEKQRFYVSSIAEKINYYIN